LPSAALIVALLAPPSFAAVLPELPPLTKPPAASAAPWGEARLTLWGAQVRWDDRWHAFVSTELPNYAVVPVWERYETPAAGADRPAPSYVVMREMDCGQHAWRTTGVVSFPAANLEGQARFQPSSEDWKPADGDDDADSIYGSVCRR
jgi:hypothetical protein